MFILTAVGGFLWESSALAQAQSGEEETALELMQWAGNAQHVLVGRLVSHRVRMVLRSFPPVFVMNVDFEMVADLRGEISMAMGDDGEESFSCHYSARQNEVPSFPLEGSLVLLTAEKNDNGLTMQEYREITAEQFEALEDTPFPPLGWTIEEDGFLSPWVSLGPDAWPTDGGEADLVCSVTGRPAFYFRRNVELTIEPVPPARAIRFSNPDGDGEYQVTLTNSTDRPVEIQALLSDGDTILWRESLVFLCDGEAYMMPAARSLSAIPQPTILEAGQSVSTVINVFQIEGPPWHRNGGSRVSFQICLGERAKTLSFYYLDSHHDPLREAALRELAE